MYFDEFFSKWICRFIVIERESQYNSVLKDWYYMGDNIAQGFTVSVELYDILQ